MNIRNYITEKIILPLSDIALGQSVSKHFKFLQKSQWWSESELKEYQNEKLRALIKHAYENVPYYTELFDSLNLTPSDINTTDDLVKLPILTKEIVRENFKNGKIIAKNIPTKKMILTGSSGSTGEPLQYYITKDAYSMNIVSNLRGWYWMGYRLGDSYAKLSQNPRNSNTKKIQDKINNCYYLLVQQLTDENFSKIVKDIQNYKPKFVRGYPDPLLFLANYINKNNICLPSIFAVNTTGNILFPENRKIIENTFKCKVFDSYSCEGGANVFECETHKCYHSSMEYAITEIISNGHEVNSGEKGRVITTDLINYAVPFIRYDTQDYVTKSKEKCSCGRNLLPIEKIDGRDSDILITPKGKYLIVHNFTGYFEWIDSVEQFQIRQDKIDEFDIILIVNSKYTHEIERKIFKYWEEYINENVKIEINVVDDIPLTKSGKRRFLIRNKDIKLKM
jgi:phenylacetate-CoA ligase